MKRRLEKGGILVVVPFEDSEKVLDFRQKGRPTSEVSISRNSVPMV